MKVIADLERCQGTANCVDLAPAVFELGTSNLVRVLDVEPSEAHRRAVEAAVRACPVRALSVRE